MPTDSRIDDYIAQSAPFAQPILVHIRDVVHATCPDVEESMKWSSPHFGHRGMLCAMSAFKEHCALGFWKASLIEGLAAYAATDGSAGNFGRLTSVRDLPPRAVLAGFIREAMRLNAAGVSARRTAGPARAPRAALPVPPALAAALEASAPAQATFDALSPSQRREYVEWISEAKRDATRDARVAQAVTWLAEGKPYNWKYQR